MAKKKEDRVETSSAATSPIHAEIVEAFVQGLENDATIPRHIVTQLVSALRSGATKADDLADIFRADEDVS